MLEEEKKTVEAVPSTSFTVLEFMKTFAEEFLQSGGDLLNVMDFTGPKDVTRLPPISQIAFTPIHINQVPSFARFVSSRKEEKVTTAKLLNGREKSLEAHG